MLDELRRKLVEVVGQDDFTTQGPEGLGDGTARRQCEQARDGEKETWVRAVGGRDALRQPVADPLWRPRHRLASER